MKRYIDIYRLLQINTLIHKYKRLNRSMNVYTWTVAYVQSVNKKSYGTRIDFEPRWGYTGCLFFLLMILKVNFKAFGF